MLTLSHCSELLHISPPSIIISATIKPAMRILFCRHTCSVLSVIQNIGSREFIEGRSPAGQSVRFGRATPMSNQRSWEWRFQQVALPPSSSSSPLHGIYVF